MKRKPKMRLVSIKNAEPLQENKQVQFPQGMNRADILAVKGWSQYEWDREKEKWNKAGILRSARDWRMYGKGYWRYVQVYWLELPTEKSFVEK